MIVIPHNVELCKQYFLQECLLLIFSNCFHGKYHCAQALHGLAPKCELINMHELIKKSTNNFVTLLPLENGINWNTKG